MKNYVKKDPWCIIEAGFKPELNRISESIFSIGNGKMGQRANFEEDYSGDSLQGSYVAGVYYPDKTKVGWWKIGYPEYFAKVLNAANWIGIGIAFDGEVLDLAQCEILDFSRVLNMKEGYLERNFTVRLRSGKEIRATSQRFCSIVDTEAGAIQYAITPLNFSGKIKVVPCIDADVVNEDSNYEEKFWEEVDHELEDHYGILTVRTKKLDFHVSTGMKYKIYRGEEEILALPQVIKKEKFIAHELVYDIEEGQETIIYKFAANLSSEHHPKPEMINRCRELLERVHEKGFTKMKEEQAYGWAKKWKESDITIEGDISAQQGIRFNIFQLNQTYTGEDERLNIGPKGFTGEKYGGSTYWDTEAYCLPFYLSTADQKVARNLVIYRYKHLQKAIENAEKLGFNHGAALYPMVTMNGEECHNEWEITFEEIHRNGAMAYAIYDYIRYTGDEGYLAQYGLEVLIGISRFWAQRVNYSQEKKQFVMLGVTGPNEYENNVNNNWYTSRMARWTMQYTIASLEQVKGSATTAYEKILAKTLFEENDEVASWKKIIDNLYLPEDATRGIFLQQEGYLDKELIQVKDLDPQHLPINQNWSWDRILRSCFIKQADVLQGIYCFEDEFDTATIKRNFDFYEPYTVHESSLSPCVHSILAARLGYKEKAYEMYLRTARLDLDDYNNDTEDGCHITSMAGTWMSIVKGFAGMRVKEGNLHFNPFTPDQWKSFAFNIRFRAYLLRIKVNKMDVEIENHSDRPITVYLYGKPHEIEPHQVEVLEQI